MVATNEQLEGYIEWLKPSASGLAMLNRGQCDLLREAIFELLGRRARDPTDDMIAETVVHAVNAAWQAKEGKG